MAHKPVRAAQHGHSMEAEARRIISSAVGAERPREVNLAEAIRQRFAALGGADDLEIPPREPARDPPRFAAPDGATFTLAAAADDLVRPPKLPGAAA